MRNTDKLGLVVPTNKATENFSTQDYVDNFDKIDNFAAAVDLSKVDKEDGKGLSTEDYTTAEKAKVANLPLDTNAQLAEKANKAQEAWITPTLLNGFTIASGHVCQYRKNEFGVVEFRGRVTGGTSNQIFQLPSSYRPSRVVSVVGVNNSQPTLLFVDLSGYVTIAGTSFTNVIIDVLTIKL